jgi:hypothetical protein
MNCVGRQRQALAAVGKQQHQTTVFFSQVSKGHFYCQASPVGVIQSPAYFLKYSLRVVGMSRQRGIESIHESQNITVIDPSGNVDSKYSQVNTNTCLTLSIIKFS